MTQQHRTSPVTWLIAALLIPGCVAGIYMGANSSNTTASNAPTARAMTPEQKATFDADRAREKAEFQQAAIAALTLKQSMKNPDSFRLEQVTRTDAGALCFSYRATNSFNAIVPGSAVMAPDGKFTAGSDDVVSKAWNRHCANKPGHDLTHVRQTLR